MTTTTTRQASDAAAERHLEVQAATPSTSSSSSRDDTVRFQCVCVDWKLPSMSAGRTLCASCLNRNLLLACKKTASALSPGTSPPGRFSPSPRAYFPGMPRAVLGPVGDVDAAEKTGHLSSAVDCRALLAASPCDNSHPSQSETLGGGRGGGEFFSESDHAADSTIRRADESATDGERGVHVLSSSLRTEEPEVKTFLRESHGGCAVEKSGGEGAAHDAAEEKWHLFQIKKNLTVRIPNPPIEISTLPKFLPQSLSTVAPRKQQSTHYSVPSQQKESCNKRPVFPVVRQSKPKKWTIRRDENAEAELMTRLLADTKPILKSSAPLALPPCYVKPPSISPVSPPGDPLWKRRCIACPKSLKLKSSSICVT